MEGQQPGDPFQCVIQRDGSLMTSQESLEGLQCCTPKCYFTRQEIEEQSPSRKDGISLKKETLVRSLYCSFLQDLGKKLQVPQLTIATAVMLCHRFYMRQSHAKNEWQTMATVSMFLACKVEETPRSLKDVVVVGYETMFKRDPLAGQRVKNKDVYEKQKELVLIGERVLLATVGFDLNIQHPYKPLVTALKRLEISQKDLTKVAWNFVNDWLQTTLCLEYKPHYVAAGSMYLAAKFFKVKLPSEKGKAWWMEFDVTPQRLEEVIQQMVKLLEQSRSPLLFSSREKVKQTTVEKKAESSSPQSCVLSRSNTTSDLRNEVSEKAGDGRSQNISQSVQSVANDDICVARKEEQVSQCQTSDCGSTQSVVEDGNRSDEGEAEPRVVVESNQTASSKVASDKGLLNKIDKERIKEALKKRRYDKLANKKVVTTTTHDDGDPESWIVRELEDGIDMQYASAEKKRRL